jgi:hypothetical protein
MLRIKSLIIPAATLTFAMMSVPSDATAGPLLDWFRGRRAATCPTPAPTNACNLQPGQCMTTCEQTCSRVVVNYVPYTAYRTSWKRVPVTSYKPVTNTDPCTGCTVTCMRPCTTYTYQMQRVPYTTYRPCYRTETYKVPVTTITNDCSTCQTCPTPTAGTMMAPSNGCSTCTTGTVVPNMSPTPAPSSTVTGTYYEYPSTGSTTTTAPSGTISPSGSFGTGTPQPADIAPSLNNVSPQSYNRPVLDQIRNGMQDMTTGHSVEPARIVPQQPIRSIAKSPVLKKFDYTPVRLASYNAPIQKPEIQQPAKLELKGVFRPIRSAEADTQLNGWVEVD